MIFENERELEDEKQFSLWKKICAGAMAFVTIGTTPIIRSGGSG